MLCLYCPIPLSFPSSNHGPCSCKSQVPISRYCHGTTLCWPFSPSCSTICPLVSYFGGAFSWSSRRKGWSTHVRASMRESPYDVLGVSPSATAQQIKRAYRKLALKYHPDVNKEANAQEKFMRIKHAYNTLTNPNKRSDYSSTTQKRSKSWGTKQEEEFYGLGDFFRDVQITIGDFFQDLQVEFQNWEASAKSQEQPKSLWEELADIGEEFVEFLEKELDVTDTYSGNDDRMPQSWSYYDKNETTSGENMKNEAKKSSIEDNINDIEAALAQLKKELGL